MSPQPAKRLATLKEAVSQPECLNIFLSMGRRVPSSIPAMAGICTHGLKAVMVPTIPAYIEPSLCHLRRRAVACRTTPAVGRATSSSSACPDEERGLLRLVAHRAERL